VAMGVDSGTLLCRPYRAVGSRVWFVLELTGTQLGLCVPSPGHGGGGLLVTRSCEIGPWGAELMWESKVHDEGLRLMVGAMSPPIVELGPAKTCESGAALRVEEAGNLWASRVQILGLS
jgi:hypothetical protein